MIRLCLVSVILLLHPITSSCQENRNVMNKGTGQLVIRNDSTNQHNSAPETEQKNSSSEMRNLIKNYWCSFFPMGTASFADSVTSYDPGVPGEKTGNKSDLKYQKTTSSIGLPDYDASQDTGSVSLGRGGCIVLKFSDNLLIDGNGPDLAVFLSNSNYESVHVLISIDGNAPDLPVFLNDSNPESVHVLISQDGIVYRSVGTVSRKNPFVDISPYAETDARYAYVKLRDNSNDEKNTSKLGADIDAVGAINTALIFSIPADSLVISETSGFGPSAKKYLSPVADRIRQFPGATVLIEAHTDDRGSENYNLIVSQQWSGLVRDYFLDKEQLSDVRYRPIGFGESRPRFPNISEETRRENRRIEILIIH